MRFEIDLSKEQFERVAGTLGIVSLRRKDGAFEDAILLPIPYEPQPTYDRGQVIREEWRPPLGKNINAHFITFNNRIISFCDFDSFDLDVLIKSGNDVFAPTYELAEEIISIREGKWLPKKGDTVTGYNSETGKFSKFLYEIEEPFTEERRLSLNNHYFPSAKQRDTFIEKNKPKKLDKIYNINGDLFILDANDRLQKVYLSS